MSKDFADDMQYYFGSKDDPDADIYEWKANDLWAEVIRLRAAIRKHRDASGHDLCWYHPELWSLLPEGYDPKPIVPPTCEFLDNCAAYRKSLEPKQ